MAEQRPTSEEWRRLYAAAASFKETAPWEWMEELDIFGVQNPENGEIGFASVMGMAGEHYAAAFYLGAEGLYGLWQFVEVADQAPERYFEIPQLQASFEDRTELNQEDREVIKALGLKFRGRNAWPLFRSYRPGYAPWFLTSGEARYLALALEQVRDVALRFKEDPSILEPPDDQSYLVRRLRQANGATWEEQWMRVPPPESEPIRIIVDQQTLRRLSRLPKTRSNLQFDLILAPGVIQEEKGERPSLAYILLGVEAGSGYILGVEAMQPHPSLRAMWGQIPAHVTTMLMKAETRPSRITVRSERLQALLTPLSDVLDVKVVLSHSTADLDRAKAALLRGIF